MDLNYVEDQVRYNRICEIFMDKEVKDVVLKYDRHQLHVIRKFLYGEDRNPLIPMGTVAAEIIEFCNTHRDWMTE